MPRVDDKKLVAVVYVRLDVVVDGGVLRKRREDIERRERPRRVLDAGRLGRDGAPQGLEDVELALEDTLVRAEDFSSYPSARA